MAAGCRVVRGPDWHWQNQDGGEGHVGTVVNINKPETEGAIWIQWDMGIRNKYRNGHDGQFDLRFIDTSAAGSVHPTITCDVCRENRIAGIRWKCNECYDYDLCNQCYMEDKHSLKHPFKRFDSPNSDGEVVPCRIGAVKLKAYGIFKGAKVEIHRDANMKDAVGMGQVIQETNVGNGRRNAVDVKWETGAVTSCKIGCEGKVEIKCKSEAEWYSYYRDHLAKNINAKADMRPSKELLDLVPGDGDRRRFKPGDKVRVKDLDYKILEVAQDGHGGWNDVMKLSVGKEGIVLKTDPDGDTHVAVGGHMWCFNSELLELVEAGNPENLGVSLLADLYSETLLGAAGDESGSKALAIAAKHGDMPTLKKLLEKNDKLVNHQCDPGDLTALQIASHEGHVEAVDYLVAMQANLDLRDSDGDSALLCAAHGNKPRVVQRLLSCGADANIVNNRLQTGIYIAAGKGHHECVVEFLKEHSQCDPNMQDADGDTPLHIAINKGHEKVLEALVNSPKVNFELCNLRGFNTLQHASLRGSVKAVELILEQPAGKRTINFKKKDGFTALHVAAVNNHFKVAENLIKKGGADLEVKNNKGFTPLMSAVEEHHKNVIEVLVEARANVNAADNDGDTSLHNIMIKLAISNLQGNIQNEFDLIQSMLAQAGISDNDRAPSDHKPGLEIAAYLVANGASLELRNKNGKTALDLNKNKRVADMLQISAIQWQSRDIPD